MKAFQKKAGLKQDGKYGDQTHAALMAAVADNDVGQRTQPEPEPEPAKPTGTKVKIVCDKVYTTDFLTKKKKKNNGEVPQYYVKDNHTAIIDEKTFALVQTKLAGRTPGQNRLSSVSIFSSKIVCGDCGGWYGPKVWHSTDKYRRVIWQCNHKFDGNRCTTP